MLQRIRDKFTGGIAVAILALIGIPFLFFGVQNMPFMNAPFAAKVDDLEITAAQFEQAYRRQIQANPALAQLPPEFRSQLRRGVLDSLIRNRLVDLYLAKKGYQVSDAQVMAAVQRVPDFQVDGKFDMERYRNVLLQNGYTDPGQFEAEQRRAMRADQLQRAIAATAVITPFDYRRYLNLVGEQRIVALASFPIDEVAPGVEVTDEQIQAYYDDNDTLFLTPESADIEFIDLRRDAIADTIEVSEEALRSYYEEQKANYLQDEQRRARHILILADDDKAAAEALAGELVERIRNGESFEALAAEYSKDGGTAANGGDLGVLTRSQMPDELGDAVFSMKVGELAGPIESDFGYHVVRLDEILEQGPQPLDQVRGDLLSQMREREADKLFLDLQDRASDALFDADSIAEIADAVGAEVQTAAGITRAGGGPIGSNQAAIDAIFDDAVLHDGQISELIDLDANRSAIFHVTAYHEAARQPLADVHDEIADTIRTQEAERIVFGRAEQLLASLYAGDEFAAAAGAAGASVSPPALISRRDTEHDPAVVRQVFEAGKPSADAPVYGQVANGDGSYTVFSLRGVIPGRPEAVPQSERDAGKLRLAQESGISDYLAFVQALYNRADIVISQDALASEDMLQ